MKRLLSLILAMMMLTASLAYADPDAADLPEETPAAVEETLPAEPQPEEPAAPVEAPVEVTEELEAPAEAPIEVTGELESPAEAPAEVIEEPEAPAEAPAEVIEEPEAPAEVTEEPEAPTEAPAEVPEEPEVPAETPAEVTEEPEVPAEAPAEVTEEPEAPAEEQIVEEAPVLEAGYYTVSAGTAVYEDKRLNKKLGQFTDEVVIYVISAEAEAAKVVFAVENETVIGYVRVARLTEIDTQEYLHNLKADATWQNAQLVNAAYNHVAPVVEEQPVEEQPIEEQPVEEQPVEEQPAEEQPIEEQPAEEQPVEEQPVEEQPVEEQPAEEQPVEEQPVEEQPVEEQPVEEQPAEEQPAKEQPVEEQPAEEQPVEEQPVEEQPAEEQPVEEQPVEEQPAEEQPVEEEQPAEEDEDPITVEENVEKEIVDTFFTLADQTEAKAVMLRWNAVEGAKAYVITYELAGKVKTLKATKLEQKVTALPMGDYTFTVQAYTDTKYKTPVGEAHTKTVTVADWTWATAPASVTATLPDPTESVITVTYAAGADGYDGFEISDNKKVILGNIDGEPDEKQFTVTNGTHTIYVRPYRYLSDGSMVYGNYVKKTAKVTVKIAWMAEKPKVKAEQVEKDEAKLSWNIVSGVDGYVIYEVINKQNVEVAVADLTGHITIGELSTGKHTFLVQPYRMNSLGERSLGTISATCNITLKDNWWYTAKITVKVTQTDEDKVRINWNHVPGVSKYVLTEIVGKTATVIAVYTPDDGTSVTLTGVSYGKHTYAITPYRGEEAGKTVKASMLTTKVIWNTAPKLAYTQTSNRSVRLTITAPGVPDRFDIYALVGKTYELITSVSGDTVELDSSMIADLTLGKSAKIKVQPVRDNETGKWSSVLTVKPVDGWKLIYDAAFVQVNAGSAMLTWRSAEQPDGYSVFRKVGTKFVETVYTYNDVLQADGTLGVLYEGLQEDEILTCYIVPRKADAKGKVQKGTKTANVVYTMGESQPTYEIVDGVLVAYNGSDANVTIPDGVTKIGEGAFKNNTTIQTVNLGDQVTEIAANAFEGCTSLTAVTGTSALTTIGDSAFAGCSALDLSFVDNVTNVADNAFTGCTATNDDWKTATYAIAIAQTGFGKYAVTWSESNANLAFEVSVNGTVAATLPAGVHAYDLTATGAATYSISIRPMGRDAAGKMAYGTSSSQSLSVTTVTEYVAGDVVYTLNGNTVTVKAYTGTAAELTISGTVDGHTVTVIGEAAFMNNTTLQSIDLPDSIEVFEENAFAGCSSLREMK